MALSSQRNCKLMQVLETDSVNVKALFRRAQAYSALMDLDFAEQDLKKVLELDPDNRSLLLTISICSVSTLKRMQPPPS